MLFKLFCPGFAPFQLFGCRRPVSPITSPASVLTLWPRLSRTRPDWCTTVPHGFLSHMHEQTRRTAELCRACAMCSVSSNSTPRTCICNQCDPSLQKRLFSDVYKAITRPCNHHSAVIQRGSGACRYAWACAPTPPGMLSFSVHTEARTARIAAPLHASGRLSVMVQSGEAARG